MSLQLPHLLNIVLRIWDGNTTYSKLFWYKKDFLAFSTNNLEETSTFKANLFESYYIGYSSPLSNLGIIPLTKAIF